MLVTYPVLYVGNGTGSLVMTFPKKLAKEIGVERGSRFKCYVKEEGGKKVVVMELVPE